ncbi:hypothetical protein BX286_3844 [Streptomyces sp. 3211.6]|uniref:hypothetical protein n=1 Tax=Streptomyces sp. 3211.6 TaxID=1938845 RepID=UPI000EAFB708|nr:hypothetical protein [Streptomyces sp. 3211.6]RKT05833.1 hypothetical protein BX286_3844 [Streptomyces sp. 3211.6]
MSDTLRQLLLAALPDLLGSVAATLVIGAVTWARRGLARRRADSASSPGRGNEDGGQSFLR